ncbi:MAG: TlpA family protein disulfide reductase [Firmicutes bacterium]|nr:TlpA family protein disulfide reductase [Bacillota bacterium]
MKKIFKLAVIGVFLTAILVSTIFMVNAATEKPAPQINRVAPDFSLKDLEGNPVNLKSVIDNNKVTILNFWATWCPPCRAEIPEFIEFVKEHQGDQVALVAVNLQENPKKVKAFAETAGMNFPILIDEKGSVAQDYQIYAIPTTFFIDSSGVIRDKVEGSISLSYLESIYRKLNK